MFCRQIQGLRGIAAAGAWCSTLLDCFADIFADVSMASSSQPGRISTESFYTQVPTESRAKEDQDGSGGSDQDSDSDTTAASVTSAGESCGFASQRAALASDKCVFHLRAEYAFFGSNRAPPDGHWNGDASKQTDGRRSTSPNERIAPLESVAVGSESDGDGGGSPTTDATESPRSQERYLVAT